MIELKNISKQYCKETTILKDIDLCIEDGDYIALMGPSGAGKTTLMNIMGCLDRATQGEYFLDGNEISDYPEKEKARLRNEKFGFVVQDFALINEMTVYENICLPSYLDHKDPDEDFIQTVMEKLGIYEKKGKYAAELSGGEQQRVAVARALSLKPSILLADEPSGNLDKKNGEQLLELMLLSQRYFDQTILLVTHDLEIARLSQRMIVLEDGKIISDTALEGEKS
mgnify:CR=1 FL=1